MKPSLFFLPAMAALVLISTARGDDAPSSEGAEATVMFAKLDANQDGKLTSDEVPADRKQLFERLVRIADKDGDGALVVIEFTAGLKPAEEPNAAVAAQSREERRAGKGKNKGEKKPDIGQVLKRLDANGDGKVTMDEVPEKRREQFGKLLGRLDKNGDKELSGDEFPGGPRGDAKPPEVKTDAAAAPNAAAKPQAAQGKPGKGMPGKGKPGDALKVFSRLDKNSDGKLTADEAPEDRPQFVTRLISRGDKDNDQAVSLAEFVAVGRERMQKGAPGANKPAAAAPGRPAVGPDGRPRGLIAVLDTDNDGKLSSSEISAAGDALRKLDSDGDGEVTPREIFGGGPKK